MRNKFLLLAVILISPLLSSCELAFTKASIDVPYNSMVGVSKIPRANEVKISVKAQDNRPDKIRVGAKKDAFGRERGPIVPNENVDVTVRHAVEEELLNRGFQLGEKSQIQVDISVSKFYNDNKLSFDSLMSVADFHFDIIVKSSDTNEQIYHRQIATQGLEAGAFVKDSGLALTQALKNGIEMLFGDSAFISALTSQIHK